jgi:ferritin-like metal-binding protein YciE
MTIESMEDLFLEQVEDLYDAERSLVKAIPKMARAGTSTQLRRVFKSHLAECRCTSAKRKRSRMIPG